MVVARPVAAASRWHSGDCRELASEGAFDGRGGTRKPHQARDGGARELPSRAGGVGFTVRTLAFRRGRNHLSTLSWKVGAASDDRE